MRPDARVWRKTARRHGRGRRRQRTAGLHTAKLLRRIRKYLALRQSGLDIDVAGRRLGLSVLEAWQIEEFLTDLINDLKESADDQH